MKLIHLFTFWVLLANLADFITTSIGLTFPFVHEGNTIAAYFMSVNYGLYVIGKLLFPTAIVFAFLIIHGFCKRWINKLIIEIVMFFLATLFTIATINNIIVILNAL